MAEWNPNGEGRTSMGSYGFAIKSLAEGLQTGVENGWIEHEEAKAEFRHHVRSIRAAEERKAHAAELRRTADELENEDN